MNIKNQFVLLLVLATAIPLSAHDKKKDGERGTLEKMEAVPCGAKQTGLAGLGTLWASAGITHINSNEKLCPQYLLRTDDMDYEIRPMDLKHATILPIGIIEVIEDASGPGASEAFENGCPHATGATGHQDHLAGKAVAYHAGPPRG